MPQRTTIADLRKVWKIADEAGFDHVWCFDHLATIPEVTTDPVYEGWSLLAAMAEATHRVRIGCLVTGNVYRHPALLAKMATTVDHLSDGRLEFAIGAGWAEAELRMLGIPYSARARFLQLSEAVTVIKRLWTEECVHYAGRFYQLEGAIHAPKPVQKPFPPMWIGGVGEHRTLHIVASHADVWNISGNTTDPVEAGRLNQVLDRYCEEIGRDPRSIRRCAGVRFGGDVEATLALVRSLQGGGFTDFIITVGGLDATRHAELAALDLIGRIREDPS